jgi:hypothetical protein
VAQDVTPAPPKNPKNKKQNKTKKHAERHWLPLVNEIKKRSFENLIQTLDIITVLFKVLLLCYCLFDPCRDVGDCQSKQC